MAARSARSWTILESMENFIFFFEGFPKEGFKNTDNIYIILILQGGLRTNGQLKSRSR